MSVADALVARRQSGGFARVYKVGHVPASPAYPYVVIGYAPSTPVHRGLLGNATPLQRFTVQHFDRSADGLEAVCADTFALFDGVILSALPGSPLCEQEMATPPNRDPDDNGVLGITHIYRF